MNSIEKGDNLENNVYTYFQNLINQGEFYFPKEKCILKKKPAYKSLHRGCDIIFDLSVELHIPGSTRASLIVIIECKNYNHAIPVNDIEEFDHKLNQVSAHKGIIVSRHDFQRSTRSIAKSRNIGLMRFFDKKGVYKWVLERSIASNVVSFNDRQRATLEEGISNNVFSPGAINAIFESPNLLTTSIWVFLDDLLDGSKVDPGSKSLISKIGGVVPYMESDDIEKVAENVLNKCIQPTSCVDLDMLCDAEKQRSGLNVVRLSCPPDDISPHILGRIIFEQKRIELYESNAMHPQHLRFTLAHELGHYMLDHGRYLKVDMCELDDLRGIRAPDVNLTDIKRLEWQANFFAASILMPKRIFLLVLDNNLRRMGIKDKGYGALYVDHQPVNRAAFNHICSSLAKSFDVSFGAVAVRLESLGVLNDVTYKVLATCVVDGAIMSREE